MNPWLGMALVLAVLAGLMVCLRAYQRRFHPHPEWVRKVLHVGMGLLTLSFPWLFAEAWPVLALAVVAASGLLAVRLVKSLRASVGDVIGGVSRSSLGEVYFPFGVALVFWLSLHERDVTPERRLLLYVVPIVCLTLADALAALIGLHFGRLRYPTVEGHKSAEGSFAFFLVALAGSFIPIATWGNPDLAQALLIATLVALLAMMFEAVAWGGLDNLVLPLATFLLLREYLQLEMWQLIVRLGVAAGLSVYVLTYRHRTTLTGSALPASVLVGYLSWALGGWPWLLAPVLFFASYTLLGRYAPRTHNVDAVLCVSSAGLLWLFLARLTGLDLLFPFTLAFAAHFTMIAIARLKRSQPSTRLVAAAGIGITAGLVLMLVVMLIAEWNSPLLGPQAGVGAGALMLAAGLFCLLQPGLNDCPVDGRRWLRQGCIAALASLLGLWLVVPAP